MNTTVSRTVSGSFNNTGGVVSTDIFALSVEGDFDYANDYLNNGNIDANNQYFTIRNGNFTNSTSIALIGNLGITANNFINTSGTITADKVGFCCYIQDCLIMQYAKLLVKIAFNSEALIKAVNLAFQQQSHCFITSESLLL